MDHSPTEKQSAVLFDLVAKDNTRSRIISQHVDNKDLEEAAAVASKSTSLFDQLNDLLDLGTLDVLLRNSNDEEFLAQRNCNSVSYSIAQMSDGERAAVLMAADVLTVEPKTLLLIDEPERHLHRSIIEPFLSALFAQRQDCAFVVSTHEIALPVANPTANVVILRSCEWSGSTAVAWESKILDSGAHLPEDLKRDILGARRRILFVEGTASSLDLPLYNALFPELSVIPKGGCKDVIRAVNGLRSSQEHHQVEAFGLIDRDGRSVNEVEKFVKEYVFALDVFSAEALYYGSDSIQAVAHRQAESLGYEAKTLIESAMQAAMEVLNEKGLSRRMAAKRCESRVRNQIQSLAPHWQEIMESGEQLEIQSEIKSPYPDELSQFTELASAGDLDGLVARYPLRESNVFDKIADVLQCGTRSNYERMVIARIREDEALASNLRQRISRLSIALGVGLTHAP